MMYRKPKKNAEFDDEYVSVTPTRKELLFVRDRNTQCQFMYEYIRHCRNDVMDQAQQSGYTNTSGGFLPCKPLIDSTYECYTRGQYGSSIEEAPEQIQRVTQNFFTCAFKALGPMDMCHELFTDMARAAYRIDPTKY